MNKKMVAIWVCLAMMLGFIVIIIEIAPVVEAPTKWYVDDVPGTGSGNPAENYTSIQAAIDNANEGDTIFVYNGTYYERLVVNKTLNLTGEGRDTTIINGNGAGDVVKVTVDWVNITRFTITNSGSSPNNDAGLELDNVQNCHILNNNVSFNNECGIYLYSSNNNIVENNKVESNDHYGIILYPSEFNLVRKNICNNNHINIHLGASDSNTVLDNIVNNGWDGVYICNSDSNTLFNNVGLNNENGVCLSGVSNTISDNILSYNRHGILIANDQTKSNTIIRNTFTSNDYGIFQKDLGENLVYHNNFINNVVQALDNGKNIWNHTYPDGGNYWSDYSGIDNFKGPGQNISGSDGIGDTNYSVDTDSVDNYPLMGPFKKYCILKQGWNLISIPLTQIDQNLTEVLENIEGCYDAVQWYDVKDTNDPWKHYKVAKPIGNDLSKLNETMGFWIHITQPGDTIFSYNGTHPTQNQTIVLYPGWNLVGYPSLSNLNRSDALNNIYFPYEVNSIWTYNATTQKWKEIGPSDYFEIGRGYWVHALTKCVWKVPL